MRSFGHGAIEPDNGLHHAWSALPNQPNASQPGPMTYTRCAGRPLAGAASRTSFCAALSCSVLLPGYGRRSNPSGLVTDIVCRLSRS